MIQKSSVQQLCQKKAKWHEYFLMTNLLDVNKLDHLSRLKATWGYRKEWVHRLKNVGESQ